MTTTRWLLSLTAVTLAGACQWTEFDDLKEDAWVHSTGRPDNDASNWGVAIQRLSRDGGQLAVLGSNESVYAEVQCGPTGDTSTTNTVELNTQFAIGNLSNEPILLADPASDEVALVTKSGTQSVVVLRGTGGQLNAHQVFGPERPDAATYMVPPQLAQPAMPAASQTLVAQDDTVYGTFFKDSPNPQPKCKLVDAAAMPVLVRALGAYRPTGQMFDDVIAWSSEGKLIKYSGGVFNGALFTGSGCALPANTQPPVVGSTVLDVGFKPVTGSQILPFEQKDAAGAVTGRFAVLQGHNDAGLGHLSLVNLDTMALVGPPRTDDKLKTAALFDPTAGSPTRYVVAGYPAASVDGVQAGVVQVYVVDTTTGIGAAPTMTLHDAEPESDQAFGRGVAVMPYNGARVIAVAADNDVFVYYRTTLYDDTRQGR